MDRRIVLLPLLALLLAPCLVAQELERGTPMAVGGRVLDTDRTPISRIVVLLEAARGVTNDEGKTELTDRLQLPTTTDDDGTFAFEWRWDPFYDKFHLAAALPIRQGGHQTFEVLYRKEISEAMPLGGIVNEELMLPESAELVWLRRVLAPGAAEDERRIFEELGRPDRYDSPKRDGESSAWWYFTSGRVYRFLEGRLEQVQHFDPIPPLD